jgi:tetratricopeptide (TPR) repeat protein
MTDSSILVGLKPEYRMQVRGPLDGGLSGASVLLVNFWDGDGQRFGVVKTTSSDKARQELRGDQTARTSWLGPFLPDKTESLGDLPDGHVALLSSLARDRIENCQTLNATIRESFNYGIDHVLHAVAFAYRDEGARGWKRAKLRPLHDYFVSPLSTGLEAGWTEHWSYSNLPGPEFPALVFEDMDERWPNPVAYFSRPELWPDANSFITTAPWVIGHGDLNPNNVLCPTLARALGQRLIDQASQPATFRKHITFIDVPYCRDVPFCFDMAFLAGLLRVLLPTMDSHARKSICVNSFKAALEEIRTDAKPLKVPDEGLRFVECNSKIWTQMRMAQPKVVEDIRAAYLACLSAATLWQAVKSVDTSRERAVSALALSALALKTLLSERGHQLAGPDYALRVTPTVGAAHTWTEPAKRLAEFFESFRGRRQILLVLGSKWASTLGIPALEDVSKATNSAPAAQSALFLSQPTLISPTALSVLGRLPIAAVLDCSQLQYPRAAIDSGLPDDTILRPVHPADRDPDWGASNLLFYFHMRGTFENISTLAFTAPDRSRNRRRLRPLLAKLKASRAGDLVVLYAGLEDQELSELHEYIQDIWSERLRGVYLGSPTHDVSQFLREWSIEAVGATLQDLLTAAADQPVTSTDRKPAGSATRVLRVANMRVDEDNQLTAAEGSVLEISVAPDDLAAIGRAGLLLDESARSALTQLPRDPREFFIGHRINFAEIHHGVMVKRKRFDRYLEELLGLLDVKHPQTLAINAKPGAGASTALRWLAYQTAYLHDIPTLVLSTGGSTAFEAIERLYKNVGRSFIVIADPRDVPSDELAALYTRCSPPRYPVVFVTNVRITSTADLRRVGESLLPLELTDHESIDLISRIGQYCPTVDVGSLRKSSTRSLFLLTLEAFGGASIKLNRFVADLLRQSDRRARHLTAVIALFSRYTHRACQSEFLQVVTAETFETINTLLEPFNQLLVLHEDSGWIVRHEQLSKCILQYCLTGEFNDQQYRGYLGEFVCKLLDGVNEQSAGADIVAEYIWALLNPQLETSRVAAGESRFINGEDGVPYNTMRDSVYGSASKAFPDHVNIVFHYGKFLSEEEKRWPDAERYLMHAYDLEPENEALLHMLGKRYVDEINCLLVVRPDQRDAATKERIVELADVAHKWFNEARSVNAGSAYSYTTAVQLDIMLIRDEFKRLGATTAPQKTAALIEENVARQLSHADAVVAQGLRYIEPRAESRRVFNLFRDQLHELRGDLNTAIECFQRHVRSASGPQMALARVQLARYLLERAEERWNAGERGKANSDFGESERQLFEVLQDPAQKFSNVKLWFDSARHVSHWRRSDFLERLLQLHDHDPDNLDATFLLACLYFCEAVETGSPESWRRHQEFQRKSEMRSSNLAVRRYIREWLVGVEVKDGIEYRIFPSHLFDVPQARIEAKPFKGFVDNRIKVAGSVKRIDSSTVGFVAIEPLGFQLFFQPRVKGHEFYKSDEGRARVKFLVAFTYEKPQAFDVEKMDVTADVGV